MPPFRHGRPTPASPPPGRVAAFRRSDRRGARRGKFFLADLDPAIADLGRIGRYPERDQPAIVDERQRRLNGRVECFDIADHMVRRHHQDRFAAPACHHRGQRDRRSGIAADGFEDQGLHLQIDERNLLLDQIGMERIGDDDRRREPIARGAARRELEHGFFRSQRKQLLGPLCRDMGHRRVPEPPERMTGLIGLSTGMR